MARRMVIQCNECGRDADMVSPAWVSATSAAMVYSSGAGGFNFVRDTKPRPPEGWFERFSGFRGTLDFCSVECVTVWDERHKDDVIA